MFMPMVRYIVYRKVREVPAQCDVEDFLSCGLEALIRSIERYDPDKGATLEQYAWTRIHGAVLDELRRHDWAPRSLRRDERAINNARESFVSIARTPAQPRGARGAQVGMTPIELTRRLDQVALAEVGSLNRIVRSDESATIERIDTLESADEEWDPIAQAERQRSQGALSQGVRAPVTSRSAKWRCCCTWRTGRCATSASASASPRAASPRSTRSCAAACTNSSPASCRCSPPSLSALKNPGRAVEHPREMDLGLVHRRVGHGRRAGPPGPALQRPRQRLHAGLQARRVAAAQLRRDADRQHRGRSGGRLGRRGRRARQDLHQHDARPRCRKRANRSTSRSRAAASSPSRPPRACATPATGSSRPPPRAC